MLLYNKNRKKSKINRVIYYGGYKCVFKEF